MCNPPTTRNTTITTPPAPTAAATAKSASAAQGDVKPTDEVSEQEKLKAKRKGRNGLRIRLDAGNTGSGTGLNIPRA